MLRLRVRSSQAGWTLGLLTCSVLFLTAGAALAQPVGAVFTMNNSAAGNQIMAYDRAADGTLSFAGAYPTQGLGTGAGLGSQGALALSEGGRWLLAVNAGSNDVSVFGVIGSALVFRSTAPSGGMRPTSVTANGNTVFVLNAGGTPNISGFHLSATGILRPLPGSTRTLNGQAPAQVSFNNGGNLLVVSNKGSNTFDVFRIEGRNIYGPFSQASNGPTPFGFSFDHRDRLLVSEAAGGAPGASSASSYEVMNDGTLQLISGSVGTMQTAACWIIVTKDGNYAYTANTGSSTLTGFSISQDGMLTLLNSDGVTGFPGVDSKPIDLAFSVGGEFLYSLNFGNGTITGFSVADDGSLGSIGSVSGLPTSVAGLVAR
jgi:6-phosphogluconolactonase (cycloisomerase 2 family)